MIDFGDAPDERPKQNRTPWGGFSDLPLGRMKTRGRELAPGEVPAYLENLNPMQKEAVLTTDGPLIVLAGAGSGKTKMLTSRIAYLMDVKGVPAPQILAVTFTNKAAREMKERVERHLEGGHYYGIPEIGTFHSICVRLLRRELQATPFTKPFVIYDDSDQLSLVKRSIEKLGIDEKAFSGKAMQAAINRLKCDAVEPHELEPAAHDIFERNLKRVYEEYQKDLFANNALDFGEIICMTYRILRDVPDVRKKYQQRFAYIHVDEYQDTNRAQYLLLSQLAMKQYGGHENICVVGDEDQSIYKWRGADIHNILDFEKDYPGAHVVKLEQNYRSTKTIIAVASQVIRNNKERKDKTLWTDNEEGLKVTRASLADERAEGEFVVGELKKIASAENRSYSEFAIFYRTHAQSRQFEEVLRREKIPYEIVGGLRFYDRKEIKDVLSYFKVLQNPQDSVSLKRIINTPARGIGKTTIDKLETVQLQLEQNRARAASVLRSDDDFAWGDAPSAGQPAGLPGETDFGDASPAGASGQLNFADAKRLPDTSLWAALTLAASDPSYTSAGTAKKLGAFHQLIEKLVRNQPTMLLSELYHLILDETGYITELRREGTDEAAARIENLEEFDTVLQEFEEAQLEHLTDEDRELRKRELLPIFLEESSLATEPPGTADAEALNPDHVSMMSLHSSKGLEYPVVFLVGLEQGLFPSIRGLDDADESEIEEERRLAYVGITRAREKLFLTHAGIRRIWGEVKYQEPAQFFDEMPSELIEFKDLSYGAGANLYRAGSSRHFGQKSYDDFSQDSGYDEDGLPKQKSSPASSHLWSPAVSKSSASRPLGLASRIGLRVDHPDYGVGKIVSQEGSGKDEKVTVQFNRGGPRKFLVRFIEGFIAG